MEYSVENISGLLIRSKLLAPEEVRTMYQRWQNEGKDRAGSSLHYLKWMVANHYLTEYQAGLIARGHADVHDFYLGQYKVLDRLGKGRMAGVYKAVHQSGQVVAIKVLPPSRTKDPQMLARFQREARLAMQLKHPNVVRSFQVGEANGLHFLVMEYLEGETLEEVLKRRKKMPINEAVRLIYQALQGLQHIHEKNFIHRDLKPANLMLIPARAAGSPDNTLLTTVKILDIGLGRELFEESARAAIEGLQLTGEGVLLGTPDYLAPEQARDPRNIDIRADIYSLGCVLYHCLAGQPPFPDTNVLNQMVRHAVEAPKPVRDFNPDVPDGLQQVLNWMLAKDPKQRYPNPERAAQALQVFMVAATPARPIEESPQMRKFLTSLEIEEKGEAKTPARAEVPTSPKPAPAMPTPAPMPVPGPAAPAAKVKESTSKELSREEKRRHRQKERADKKQRKKRQPHVVSDNPTLLSTPAPLQNSDIDVELVTLPTPAPQPVPLPAKKPMLALSRRDWILLSLGAGAVISAVLIGWLIAKFS